MFEKIYTDAFMPTVMTSGSAGHDLYCWASKQIPANGTATVKTGIKVDIPCNYVGLLRGRSGMAFNNKIWCFEGTIDADYRGEIGVQLLNTTDKAITVKAGERIAQLVIVPFMVDKSLVKNVTREGGFGSTD